MGQQQNESFCNRLRWLMEECGVSAVNLSREIGVSHVAVGNWLQGAKPRPKFMRSLADYFGCDVQYLLHGVGDPPDFLPEQKLPVVVKETGPHYEAPVDRRGIWMDRLRVEYQKDPNRVATFVRAAWPKAMAEEIIAWLGAKK